MIEGRQHKMEVWESREQQREAKEREERLFSKVLDISHVSENWIANNFVALGKGQVNKTDECSEKIPKGL